MLSIVLIYAIKLMNLMTTLLQINMTTNKEYLIENEKYLDVTGTANVLNKSIGTIRNTFKNVGFPSHVKIKGRVYFKKDEVIKYKKDQNIADTLEVVEITDSNK